MEIRIVPASGGSSNLGAELVKAVGAWNLAVPLKELKVLPTLNPGEWTFNTEMVDLRFWNVLITVDRIKQVGSSFFSSIEISSYITVRGLIQNLLLAGVGTTRIEVVF